MIIRRVFATVLARIVPCDTPAHGQQKTIKSTRAANKEMQ